MERIKSITEAFSMQPEILSITDVKSHEHNLYRKSKYINPDNDIRIIKKEVIQISEGERASFYIGYNYEGKKKFQYLEKSVNVHFV